MFFVFADAIGEDGGDEQEQQGTNVHPPCWNGVQEEYNVLPAAGF